MSRLLESGRDALKERPEDDHIPYADDAGYDHNPERVHQTQLPNEQVVRNETAAEIHSHDARYHIEAASH